MVGLVQITCTVLLLIAMTALMTGGLEATDTYMSQNHYNNNHGLNDHTLAVMILTGSLIGPGKTVNADIAHVYSVNGFNPLTAPFVLIKAT